MSSREGCTDVHGSGLRFHFREHEILQLRLKEESKQSFLLQR